MELIHCEGKLAIKCGLDSCIPKQDKATKIGTWFRIARQQASQGHALPLDLRNPRCNAILCHSVFIVLIEREAQKLVTPCTLGLIMLVCTSVYVAHHLRTCGRKRLMQLFDAITKIVPVARRVATSEDSHGFASKVGAFDVVQQVVPRRSRAVLIGACVPRWATHNQAVVASEIFRAVLTDVRGLNTCLVRDGARHRFGVACLCSEENADCLTGRATTAPGCSIHGAHQVSGSTRVLAGWTPRKADLL